MLHEICSGYYWLLKALWFFFFCLRHCSCLMTSNAAYLTALAHSSSKQRVLKADIQTSTGDTDVCRQKCSMSVFRRRCCCCSATNLRHQRKYLNCCESGVDGFYSERIHKGTSKAVKSWKYYFFIFINTDAYSAAAAFFQQQGQV